SAEEQIGGDERRDQGAAEVQRDDRRPGHNNLGHDVGPPEHLDHLRRQYVFYRHREERDVDVAADERQHEHGENVARPYADLRSEEQIGGDERRDQGAAEVQRDDRRPGHNNLGHDVGPPEHLDHLRRQYVFYRHREERDVDVAADERQHEHGENVARPYADL